MDFVQEGDEVLERSAEAIDRPRHYDIELAPHLIAAESVKLRTLVPTLGSADAVVGIDLYDLAIFVLGDST